ncbi:homeobox protein Hox-B3a-like [Plodia interpunctella]|uniref:homeobox protein Hox-B3a-like n=1 Tax=Plodia interpunctella TaxID=58824 RepID=UPI0023683596|nr:homeobox protein Hox-B3a-like [Plodia interpunctella]
MSVPKSIVSDVVYCDTSDHQWVQEPSPNIPQTVMESDLYELSPQNPPTNGSPPAYHPPNGLPTNGTNGVNGINYMPSNTAGSYDRNATQQNANAGLPNGLLNGMRALNIPNHNVSNVMIRSNGMNMITNANGYINAANPRYLSRPTSWVTPTKSINGVKKQKRNRTAFTSQQMMELEQEYARTRYLDRTRRIELSEILHLNERTIKIWFQNRRMKEKKDRAESLEDSEEVSTTESSPELGMSGSVPMPLLIHEQYPATVTNDVYGRGTYVDYQPSPSPMVPAQLVPNVNDYSEYISAEAYDAQCRQQLQLQVQHQVQPSAYPMYNELEAVHTEPSTSQPDSCPPAPTSAPEQNWDLSWIRSMQIDEEF